jgi:electron transport complex protein RnfB
MRKEENSGISRRELLKNGAWYAGLIGLCGSLGWLSGKARAKTLWQIDPNKCIQCGKCATECVLTPSASKCVHAHAMCGYCKLCTGFFQPSPNELNEGAENQQCPTGAIKRSFVEDPYYEYIIEEKLCIGCGICVKGCTAFGNGSLFLQIRHNVCENCNECAIAKVCPAQAIVRVPNEKPYLLKNKEQQSEA